MPKKRQRPPQHVQAEVPALVPIYTDKEAPSRQELLDELEVLRAENAYLKKLKALVQAQQKSAPDCERKS